MFGAPIDAWYVWIGLVAVGGAALGIASTLPAAVPPDADGAARTVGSVAASDHAAVGRHPLPNAESIRVGSDSISLRGPGGTEHAAFGYGPVTPVPPDSKLRRVLDGHPPGAVFGSEPAFEAALERAAADEPTWRPAGSLTARRVSWRGTDAVLVG